MSQNYNPPTPSFLIGIVLRFAVIIDAIVVIIWSSIAFPSPAGIIMMIIKFSLLLLTLPIIIVDYMKFNDKDFILKRKVKASEVINLSLSACLSIDLVYYILMVMAGFDATFLIKVLFARTLVGVLIYPLYYGAFQRGTKIKLGNKTAIIHTPTLGWYWYDTEQAKADYENILAKRSPFEFEQMISNDPDYIVPREKQMKISHGPRGVHVTTLTPLGSIREWEWFDNQPPPYDVYGQRFVRMNEYLDKINPETGKTNRESLGEIFELSLEKKLLYGDTPPDDDHL